MIYRNYGDVNFLTYGGCLVDSDHSDTEFRIIYLRPYDDEEGLYQCAEIIVDINDSWIDRSQVMKYGGVTEDDFDPVLFAIDCIEYYGPENFWADGCWMYQYDWRCMTREGVKEVLRNRVIATDNIEIEW